MGFWVLDGTTRKKLLIAWMLAVLCILVAWGCGDRRPSP